MRLDFDTAHNFKTLFFLFSKEEAVQIDARFIRIFLEIFPFRGFEHEIYAADFRPLEKSFTAKC
jgi:hypothetical protein